MVYHFQLGTHHFLRETEIHVDFQMVIIDIEVTRVNRVTEVRVIDQFLNDFTKIISLIKFKLGTHHLHRTNATEP